VYLEGFQQEGRRATGCLFQVFLLQAGADLQEPDRSRIFANQKAPEVFAQADQEMLTVEAPVNDLVDRQQNTGCILCKDLVEDLEIVSIVEDV